MMTELQRWDSVNYTIINAVCKQVVTCMIGLISIEFYMFNYPYMYSYSLLLVQVTFMY